ncbi:MAG: DUF2452 domain-containing protein [Chitinophagales bacterium]|nr:DUF2452 domain-containing protein [Chitinophagales bacterium]
MKENPIDKDKITENPHNLPYAHNIGSALIKPIDKAKVKGKAMAAMYEQTENQMEQLREQMQLLASQAQKLHDRVRVSEKIYQADMGFEPLVGHEYYLYLRSNGRYLLSLVAPEQWGSKLPFQSFEAKVKLLADHTWDMIET